MSRALRLGLCLTILVMLTGCWNSRDIQNMAYVTAIGFDYENSKFVTYVQVLNFANVAKTENAPMGDKAPAWIGKGEGVTVTESMAAIYATSQLRVFWGHVKAVVLTDRFLSDGRHVQEAYDMVNRYREIRYNVLLYGTKLPLRDIFSQKSILNLSPLDTVLETPTQIYSQRSFIMPVYGFKIISQFNEPSQMVMFPSLTLVRDNWSEDKKKKPMFRIDGAFYVQSLKLAGWLSEEDLAGYRWLQKKMRRSPINVPDNDQPQAALIMVKSKPTIKPTMRNGKVVFDIKLKMEAYVDEMVKDISRRDLERLAAESVAKQIRTTFNKGIAKKIDVLQLSEHLYRKWPKVWHDWHKDSHGLTADSLDRVDVKIKLIHTGKYKGRTN